jgi:hypothetical protein
MSKIYSDEWMIAQEFMEAESKPVASSLVN